MARLDRTVRITRDDEGVHINPRSPSVVGDEVLVVHGGVLRVDPGRPEDTPSMTVIDAEDSLPLIVELWGGAVAEAVMHVEPVQHVTGAPGPGLKDLATLAMLRWLRRWCPIPLDQSLLSVELAAASYRCRDLVEVEGADLLDLPECLLMISRLTPDTPLAGPVSGLLGDCLAGIEQDQPQALEAVDLALRTLRQVQSGEPAPRAEAGAAEWLPVLAPQRALAAEGPDRTRLAGVSSVDWFRVRSHVVGREEDGVHWSIDQSVRGAQLCVVASAASPGPSHPVSSGHLSGQDPDPLRFRLLLQGWPLPAAEGELRQVTPSGPWSGAVQLEGSVASAAEDRGPRGVTVDVASAGQRTPPPTGDQALVRAVCRRAARATMARRLLRSGLTLAPAARDSLASATVASCRAAQVLLDELAASDHPEAVAVAEDWLLQLESWLGEMSDGDVEGQTVELTVSEAWAVLGDEQEAR